MFSWYIDNNNYITQEFVDTLLENVAEAKTNDEPLKEVYKRKNPTMGNPSAPPTCARDVGILDANEDLSDTTRLYQNGLIPFSNLIFELIAKRNVSRTERISMKPLIILCKVFSKMSSLEIDEAECFLTTAECYEYLSVLSNYEEITDEIVNSIVQGRSYTGSQHVPAKRVTVKNEACLTSIFNALVASNVFVAGVQKSIIHPQKKYSELIDYIAENGTRISIAPVTDGNRRDAFHSYCSDIHNGILEIIPELPLKGSAIPSNATQDVYNYLFGVETENKIRWDKYFEQDCKGIYRIFFPIQWLVIAKIYLKNSRLGENLFDFVKQHPLYKENYTEDKLMIELPFSNSEHTNLDELTNEYVVSSTTKSSNRKAFRLWAERQVKPDGEPYTSNTLDQYINALARAFREILSLDVFDIKDKTHFDKYEQDVRGDARFDALNEKSGKGALSSCIKLYGIYLQELSSEIDLYRIAANNINEFISSTEYQFEMSDEEIQGLYTEFLNKFSPNKLASLSDEELLNYVFYTIESENDSLCYFLELQPQIREAFGSVAGGSSYKFGLFQRKEDGAWLTGSPNKPKELSPDDALAMGKDIVEKLIKGAEIISSSKLDTIEDYERLDDDLNSAIGKYATFGWVHKYFHMLYPKKIATWHSTDWQNHILYANGILPNQKYYARSGQLVKIATIANLPMATYAHASAELFGDIKTFCRVGTSNEDGNHFDTLISSGLVSIGWNSIGSLENYKKDKEISRKALTTALEAKYYSTDKSTASRKAGEIANYYNTNNNTIFVAMDGESLLALGDNVGDYYFDTSNPMAHCKKIVWHQCFDGTEKLPIKNEGLLTTCVLIKKPENLLYLYNLYYNGLNNEEKQGEELKPITHRTNFISEFSRNRILFGAPGTGKSFTLNGDRRKLLYGDETIDEETLDLSNYGEYERVTFHPDYTYANFVGTYKPTPCKDNLGNDAITYSFVPGPFMRIYVSALKNSRTDSPKPYLLIVEEINRANMAAVFGDVFQLLDRGEDNVSEYSIQATEDIKKYLADELGGKPNDYSELRIPDNMFIWATMNSADQGVFPMDTAFKRRWDFKYLGIDNSEEKIAGKVVTLGRGTDARVVEWNNLRKAINEELLTYKVNEDKLMGAFFIAKKYLPDGDTFDAERFIDVFKNKVLMYLFDDAAKQKRASLFSGCSDKSKNQYSKICTEFDEKGVFIFCEAIHSQFTETVEKDD